MPSIVSHVTAEDGTDILVRHWPMSDPGAGGAWAGAPWASVLMIHGLDDHSGRYEAIGVQLAGAGLDVHAYDQRGMGGSGGRPGDIARWSIYHDDLRARLDDVRVVSTGRPVALYGHSLGGLIVAGYLLDDRPKPDVAVLSAPALDSTIPGWKRRLAVLLGRVAPTVKISNGIDVDTLSRDPMVGIRKQGDPFCIRVSTARFGVEGLREQARVRAAASRGFGIPTLVLHGEDDGLVPVDASAILDGAPLVERRTYPGLRHELHNEPEGAAIVDEIVAWIRTRATLATQPNTASGERTER